MAIPEHNQYGYITAKYEYKLHLLGLSRNKDLCYVDIFKPINAILCRFTLIPSKTDLPCFSDYKGIAYNVPVSVPLNDFITRSLKV